jgi:hypothetical protein
LNWYRNRLHSEETTDSIVAVAGDSIVVLTEPRAITNLTSFGKIGLHSKRSRDRLRIIMADDRDGTIAGKERSSYASAAVNRAISQSIARTHHQANQAEASTSANLSVNLISPAVQLVTTRSRARADQWTEQDNAREQAR